MIEDVLSKLDQIGLLEGAKYAAAFAASLWFFHFVPVLPAGTTIPRSSDILGSVIWGQLKHVDVGHLKRNSIVLLLSITYFCWKFDNPVVRLVAIFLSGGLLYWILGNPATESVGASIFVFAIDGWLVSWFVFSGMEDRALGIVSAIIVLGWLRMDTSNPWVNHHGHAVGAMAGGALAWAVATERAPAWL